MRKNFVLLFLFFSFLPLPIFPCWTRVVAFPLEPYNLNFCAGYFLERLLFSRAPGASVIAFPSLLVALALALSIAFLYDQRGKIRKILRVF